MKAASCLLLLLAAARGASLGESPVAKVVQLIQEMKAKIEADGKAEQKVYDKFACWCEKTTARKAGSMDEAKAKVAELTDLVLQLKGKTASFKADIAQLEKDIAANTEEQGEATGIREKEQADYGAERSDLEQATGALERAITILTGAGEGASALQEAQLLGVAGQVSGALHLMPKGDETGSLSEQDRQFVETFVGNPMKFMEDAHSNFAGIQEKVKGPFGDYAPASGAIQGILKGMYDAFTGDLEKKNVDEATKQKEYEEFKATKTAELETMTKTLNDKKTTFATDSKTMTDSSVERDETAAQLETDSKFFEETKKQCKTQADDWAERSRLRNEELAGIVKAIEILTSDEAQATFGRANSMLLQKAVRSTSSSKLQMAERVFSGLKNIARQQKSLRLAAVTASMVQLASKGAMEPVISAVDKMLAELRQEEQDDITLRDYCQAEEVKVETEIEDTQHEMDTLQGLIERLTAKKDETQATIKQTETDIKDTQTAMDEALATRNSETEEFKAALKDDMDAVALMAKAIEAITAFSKNNPSLVQKSEKHSIKAHRDPEYAVDPDAAPETFSKPYSSASTGGGIESIMGYIKEDLENEIKTSKADEAKAQEEFMAQRETGLKSIEELNTKKTSLEQMSADLDEKVAEAENEKEGKKGVKNAKKKYREDLKPKCDWMKDAFDTRRTKRQAEMNGMMEAKAELAGKGDAELVQTKVSTFLKKASPA